MKAASERKSDGFSAIDIELATTAMNAAEITLTARYPQKGFALNQESEMIVRILKGSTTFTCEVKEVELIEGDTLLVETNKKYFWMPHGSVTLYTVSSPPWTPEQHRTLDTKI